MTRPNNTREALKTQTLAAFGVLIRERQAHNHELPKDDEDQSWAVLQNCKCDQHKWVAHNAAVPFKDPTSIGCGNNLALEPCPICSCEECRTLMVIEVLEEYQGMEE